MHTLRSGYRFGCSRWWKHWLRPRTYTSWIRFYYQRATRGWADCDTWSLDGHLNQVLPGALRHLRDNLHGCPCDFVAGGNVDKGAEEWRKVLNKMIAGFEANDRIDGLYEDELGRYPSGKNDFSDINDPERRAVVMERLKKTEPLQQRDQKLFEEGMALFVKHYNNLWD